jgi:SAM-dependent methyltransferase
MGIAMSNYLHIDGGSIENDFKQQLSRLKSPKVLELGTLQWAPGKPTHHGVWLPPDSTFVKSDVQAGADVDVVADAHDLSAFQDGEFDALMAVSVWEHLRKPWIAAEAARRVLKSGGILYVATHFVFPLHGYPSDYCRWTYEGLLGLFDEPEWTNRKAGHSFPCSIKPPPEVKVWNTAAPAYLNVNICATKA